MRSLMTAGFRIVLILAFLQALITVGNDFYGLWANNNSLNGISANINFISSAGTLLIAFLVILLIFWVLWWKAGKICIFLAGDISDSEITINTSNVDLIKVVLRIFGMCLIVLSLSTLCGHIAYHIRYAGLTSGIESSPSHQANEMLWWVTDGLKIIIGIWLVLGFRGIFTAISKIWNAAHMTDDELENQNNSKISGE
jgi:hypothetical protein